MQVAAYMLSLLARQHRLLGAGFFQLHDADWLVWEPGPSAPARTVQQSNTQQTINPRVAQPAFPYDDDALCFELKRTPGSTVVRVGRATENEVVVNDLTVSREHFSLSCEQGGWWLKPGAGALQIEGALMGPGPVALRGDAVIRAGDVRLTFYTVAGFIDRLQREADRGSR